MSFFHQKGDEAYIGSHMYLKSIRPLLTTGQMIALEGLRQPQMVTDDASNLVTCLFIAVVEAIMLY